MFLTKDSLRFGLILGFIGPLVGLIVVYRVKFPSLSFTNFLDYFIHNNNIITNVGTFFVGQCIAIRHLCSFRQSANIQRHIYHHYGLWRWHFIVEAF